MYYTFIEIHSAGIILKKTLLEYHETERAWPTGPYVPVISGIS